MVFLDLQIQGVGWRGGAVLRGGDGGDAVAGDHYHVRRLCARHALQRRPPEGHLRGVSQVRLDFLLHFGFTWYKLDL